MIPILVLHKVHNNLDIVIQIMYEYILNIYRLQKLILMSE